MDRYLGKWYENMRDKDTAYEMGICSSDTYSLNDDGSIRVRFNEWIEGNGEWNGLTGRAIVKNPERKEGYLEVKFGPVFPAGSYHLLGTDYDNYAVVYSCEGIADFYNIEYTWILTR